MIIRHHPHEDTLVAYAAGTLDEARGLLLATHLTMCPPCRAAVSKAEMIGGLLLEMIESSVVSDATLDAILARLDESAAEPELKISSQPTHLVQTGSMPGPLRDYVDKQRVEWRWLGPGIRRHDIILRGKTLNGAQPFLLSLDAETVLPQHDHSGDEMTLVLQGGYSDCVGHYRSGDIQHIDNTIGHQPVVDPGEQCTVLTVTNGPLRFTGWLPRLLQPILSS